MKVRFRPEAERELTQARDWYAACAPGLGREFLRALDTCLEGILLYPQAPPLVHGEVRRALFRQFPYSLTFRVETDGILVISCRHYRQKPISRG